MKALSKVDELFEKNWLSAILLSDKPPAKYERNVERNVDCRSLTIFHILDIFVYHRPNLDINSTKKIGW